MKIDWLIFGVIVVYVFVYVVTIIMIFKKAPTAYETKDGFFYGDEEGNKEAETFIYNSGVAPFPIGKDFKIISLAEGDAFNDVNYELGSCGKIKDNVMRSDNGQNIYPKGHKRWNIQLLSGAKYELAEKD